MATMPKISVVIPNFNHSKYLRQRIESILNQTYRNFEVIILDDCSTDGSREIIEDYVRSPLVRTIIFNDKNSGSPFKQWKKGIEMASGEWIWIAESDDYADKTFLEVLISETEGKQNVGLVYCDSRIVDDDGGVDETFASIKNKKLNTFRWSGNYLNSGIDEIEKYLLPDGTINNTSAVLFHKETLISVNPFDIDLRYIGDKYAFLKVLSKSNVLYVNESLNYYRDPFTTKHFDKFVNYFYEHFLVFNWVYRNLEISKERFFKAFYLNTRNSVYRDWSKEKLLIYSRLYFVNPPLLLKCFIFNLLNPFRKEERSS